MHLSDGEIKGYIEQEIAERDLQRVSSHLDACDRCQQRAQFISTQSQRVDQQLAVLDPDHEESPLSASAAYAQFDKRYSSRENRKMLNRIFNRQTRLAWIALGVVAILAVAFAFPQIRAVGSSFLGLFRVEQFTVLQIDPDQLEEQLSSASQFEYLFAEDVQVEEFGESREVADAAQASDLAGFQVRLPTAFDNDGNISVQPGAKVSYQVDLPKVQALLNEIGVSDLELPSDLDGADVSMTLPVAVSAAFGECELPEELIEDPDFDPDMPMPDLSQCTTLMQFPSPEISAPPGLDIGGLGEKLLPVLGMSPEEAAQFSRTVDWTTTLIIPVPRYGTEYQDVFVDGVEGTLIMQSMRSRFPEYLLIWVKDGIVYALAGPGDAAAALEVAESLE